MCLLDLIFEGVKYFVALFFGLKGPPKPKTNSTESCRNFETYQKTIPSIYITIKTHNRNLKDQGISIN